MSDDFIDNALIGVASTLIVGALLALVAVLAWLVIVLFGGYEYDYRCREGVVESRYELFKSVPIGGWGPVDDDPVGACHER